MQEPAGREARESRLTPYSCTLFILDELRNGDLIYFSAQYDYTIVVFIIQKVCTPVTV